MGNQKWVFHPGRILLQIITDLNLYLPPLWLAHFYLSMAYLTKGNFFSENVGRLKKLEYLNLALNNVTRVENLEGKWSWCRYEMKYFILLLQLSDTFSMEITDNIESVYVCTVYIDQVTLSQSENIQVYSSLKYAIVTPRVFISRHTQCVM